MIMFYIAFQISCRAAFIRYSFRCYLIEAGLYIYILILILCVSKFMQLPLVFCWGLDFSLFGSFNDIWISQNQCRAILRLFRHLVKKDMPVECTAETRKGKSCKDEALDLKKVTDIKLLWGSCRNKKKLFSLVFIFMSSKTQ